MSNLPVFRAGPAPFGAETIPTMTTETTTSADALSADISAPAGPSTEYAIAPEDRHYLDRLASIDPLDAPAPHEFPDHWAPKVEPSLEMLSPEMQAGVRQQLASIPFEQRAAKEPELVISAIRGLQSRLRARSGFGANATPYHRELAQIAAEYDDLGREFDRYSAALTEIADYRTERDPETGELRSVPVYAVDGVRRDAYVKEQARLLSTMRSLVKEDGSHSFLAQQRMRQARWETVELWKKADAQVAERAEAKALAAEMARKERIEKQARSLANMQRNDF